MATSGTSTFTATRNQIIRQAALDVNAISAGAVMGPAMLDDFAFRLNAMVKHWQAEGLHVWTEVEATLFPQVGQTRYAIGSSGDHATLSYVATELTADAVASATALTVDSIDDIAAGDHIGVVLDDGTLYWSTASGAPASSTINLAVGLTGAASSGAKVYAYTTKTVRPLRIIDARTCDAASGRETPIAPMLARLDYQALPNKAQLGKINQAFYDPQRRSLGYLSLWMTPSTVDDLINFTAWRPIEDFSAAGDNPDLPDEWIKTLIANLAMEMAPQYPVKGERLAQIVNSAQSSLDTLKGWDREAESIEFGVDLER